MMDVHGMDFSAAKELEQCELICESPYKAPTREIVHVQAFDAARLELAARWPVGIVKCEAQHAIPAPEAFERDIGADTFRASDLEGKQAYRNQGCVIAAVPNLVLDNHGTKSTPGLRAAFPNT